MKTVFSIIWFLCAFTAFTMLVWHQYQQCNATPKPGVTTTQPANGLYKASHYINNTNTGR